MRPSIATLVVLLVIVFPPSSSAKDFIGSAADGGNVREKSDTSRFSQQPIIVATATLQRNGVDEAPPESPAAFKSKPEHQFTTRSTIGATVLGVLLFLILVI